MLLKIIIQQDNAWIKGIGILMLWVSLCMFLLMQYGLNLSSALIDTTVYTVLVLLGFMLLENIFRFYIPSKSNWFLVFLFPFIFSVIVLYTGDLVFKWLLPENLMDMSWISSSFFVRGFILYLIFNSYSFMLNFQGKIEEQAATEERELKMQQMAKEAELYQLRQQLQPHFLFNSLNSVSALVKSQPDKARQMVLQLSDFLRGTIGKESSKWIELDEEIDFLKLFTEIEKVRFGHRLKVDFAVDEEIKQMKLPHLMVQPLVENAIKHGLYSLTGEVTIVIRFQRRASNLQVVVSNPFDPKAGQAKGSGFGLEAVNRRLFLIFGRYDLLKTNATGSQFTIELLIPQLS